MRIVLTRSNPKDAALQKLAKTLSQLGRVDCYIWDRQNDFKPAISNEMVHYRHFRLKAGFYSLGTLCKLLLFQIWLFFNLLVARAEIIHAIDLDTGLPAFFAAKLSKKKLIYHCLDPYYAALPPRWPSYFARLARWTENKVISAADAFVITDHLRLSQHEGAFPRQTVEVANVPVLSPGFSLTVRHEGFKVGYLGSLISGRNLMILIDACGELAPHGIRLIIGSFGPLEAEIEAYARRWSNVTYRHWMPYDQVLLEESGMDVIVHMTDPDSPSQKWVSPNKLYEAMALAKPIIVAKNTLAAQRVELFGNGLIVDYGSKEELQSALLRLASYPDYAKGLGCNGREEFERNWRPEIMEERLVSLYRGLIGNLDSVV